MGDYSALMIRQALIVEFGFRTFHWKKLLFPRKRWRLFFKADRERMVPGAATGRDLRALAGLGSLGRFA